MKCSSQDWCNTNLWQKTSCHRQHLLCPSSSHEKLIWLELWREAGGIQGSGSCREGARGRSFPTQCSSFLNLLPFCSTSTAVTKTPFFPVLPVFCPPPCSPGKEGHWPHSYQLHGYRTALLETHPAGVCSCDTSASLTWIIGLSHSKPPSICIAPCRVCFCSLQFLT